LAAWCRLGLFTLGAADHRIDGPGDEEIQSAHVAGPSAWLHKGIEN
jgi:hypothetical protein